jgi:hypothetical protein
LKRLPQGVVLTTSDEQKKQYEDDWSCSNGMVFAYVQSPPLFARGLTSDGRLVVVQLGDSFASGNGARDANGAVNYAGIRVNPNPKKFRIRLSIKFFPSMHIMQNRSFDNLLYVEVVENFILSKIAGLSIFVDRVVHELSQSKVDPFSARKNRFYGFILLVCSRMIGVLVHRSIFGPFSGLFQFFFFPTSLEFYDKYLRLCHNAIWIG